MSSKGLVIEREVIHWQESRNNENKSKKSKKRSEEATSLHLSEPLLPQFFPTQPQKEFVRDYFQKNVVVSKGFDLSEVSNTLYDLDVKKMLAETASDQIHVWLKTTKPLQSGSEENMQVLDSITVDDHEQAYKLYQAGHSLYCRASAEFESMVVLKLANELQYGVRNIFHNDRFRRGEVEMFFSRANHFTDFHSDFQENFTLQLSGSKRWIFQESKATHPLRGCTPHFNLSGANTDVAEQQVKVLRLGNPTFSTVDYRAGADGNGPHRSVVLHPGDIMYHPAGVWHRVECIEDSISINISLTSVSYADIFCSSLQQMLLENPRWRSAVFPARDHLGGHSEDALSVMQSLLAAVPELVKALSPQDVLPFPMLHEHLPTMSPQENSNDDSEGGSKGGEEDESVDSAKISEESMEEDMEDLEEVDGSEGGSDGFVEVEENGDDDDDGDERKRLEIVIPHVDVDQSLALLLTSLETPEAVSSSEKNKKRKAVPSMDDVNFRFNPAAVLITDQELASLSTPNEDGEEPQSVPYRRYIVNLGFGNETLESACRAEIVVTAPYQTWMDAIVKRYHNFHVHKHQALVQNNAEKSHQALTSSTWTSAPVSVRALTSTKASDVAVTKKSKSTSSSKDDQGSSSSSSLKGHQECQQLLLGLYQAGLLTPIQ